MTDIWTDETLRPEPKALATMIDGVKSSDLLLQYQSLKSRILIHTPKAKMLREKQLEELTFVTLDSNYWFVRLGCEFDAGPNTPSYFVSATFTVYLWPEANISPRVHDLAPMTLDAGEPHLVTVKLSPSIKIASVASISLGEIGTNLTIGQVAPIVHGFMGRDEREPYWQMEHHRKAPLRGIRHFWLIVNIPRAMQHCFISCRLEGYLNTRLGRLLMVPEERDLTHRKRFNILTVL